MTAAKGWKVITQILKENLPKDLSFYSMWNLSPDQEHRPNFLDTFYPVQILPYNVSSVSGLSSCLVDLLEFVKNTKFGPKLVLNIFFSVCFKNHNFQG